MKIRTGYDGKEWTALDDDTYDGAEDSSNRYMIGTGATIDEAIADLKRLFEEREGDEPEWKQ